MRFDGGDRQLRIAGPFFIHRSPGASYWLLARLCQET
jgi:hypothetical protein